MAPDTELADWAIVTAESPTEGNLVLRLRMEKPEDPAIESFSTSIVIRWPYEGDRHNPKPADDVNQRMLTFETALDELAMDNGFSYLMVVGTGLGLREWVYYTQDRDRFMERLNELLDGHPAYPVEIEIYDDPDWENWSYIRSQCGDDEVS